MFRYVKNFAIYLCPTDAKRAAMGVATAIRYTYPLSYSMNCDFINASTKRTICLDVVRRTKDLLLFIHESRATINDGDFNWRSSDVPSDVHYDGTTVVYLDTHAVWHSAKMLTKQKTTLLWDPLR